MILFNKFGYALRHEIKFDAKAKRGTLKLWSRYDGSTMGQDPLTNTGDSVTEFFAHQISQGGGNYKTEFPIGNDEDVFSLLAALILIKNGKDFSFSNYQDRVISFSRTRDGKLIVVKIRYNSNTGKMVLDEINRLEQLTRNILVNLGYSFQEISDKVEIIIAQSTGKPDRSTNDS